MHRTLECYRMVQSKYVENAYGKLIAVLASTSQENAVAILKKGKKQTNSNDHTENYLRI